MTPLELWAGLECTVNRVNDRYSDQVRRSGHERRLDDLDRFASLGISALRYPVLWERHAPRSEGNVDLAWADERLRRLRELGIQPIVGLVHHGSGPQYTSLLDPDFAPKLARYARVVAERFPWVTTWTPINEPLTTARFSALYGHWYPHVRNDEAFVRALVNQARGTVLAMREIRAVNPAAQLLQTEDIGVACGTTALRRQLAHERERRWLTWDLLAGRVDPDHPLWEFLIASGATAADLAFFREADCPADLLGLNYYVTSDRWLDERIERYPAWSHGGNAETRYADVEAVRACPDGIVGHERHLLDAWQRYHVPVAITEAHLGCTRDEQLRWLQAAWQGAVSARGAGADVRAVTAWALLGSYDWNSLATEERGCYEPGAFDVRSPSPRETALAGALRQLASGQDLQHPVARGAGWWLRPERILWGAIADTAPAARGGAPPLVVFGSRGTLGRAFQRVCAMRGLPVHVVSRAEVDISDPTRADALLRRIQPWAVVNAAGYVRVDDAEREEPACRRDNVTGAVNLAAACHRRSVPFATFSSDLVFDGGLGRPYIEDDTPAPLNVYGGSKAEAERRVLSTYPNALMVRTSAFFGPWDDYNFATQLWRALADDQPYRAAADVVVSPTYVPHLVNAVLDLLIDGECGIWHLANQGALTWYAFALLLAESAGLPGDLVHPAPMVEICGPATRPAFTALTSARGTLLPPLEEAVQAYVQAQAESMPREHRGRASSGFEPGTAG